MEILKKKLEDMDVMDDFLMGQIASDEEIGTAFCRRLLTSLLHKQIGKLRIVTQKVIPSPIPQLRGIRMDVEVDEFADDNEYNQTSEEPAIINIYDLEPHLQKNRHLPRHNRFYQAKIDSRGLHSGEKDFSKLPNLYVLTILNFDPFKRDYMVYTIRNTCQEIPDLDYDDGLCFYYFYTNGTRGGSPELKTMLQYLQDSRPENVADDATQELHGYVSKVKQSPEVKEAYMRFEEIIYSERQDAAAKAERNAKIQDILDLLEDYGPITEAVKTRLEQEEDEEQLRTWLRLAARCGSMETFIAQM